MNNNKNKKSGLLPDHLVSAAHSINLLNLVESYGIQMKKQGKDHFGLCPFHSETTPSFTVTPSKNLYRCMGCGCCGDPIKFVQEYESVSFREAVLRLTGESDPAGDYKPPISDLPKAEKAPVQDTWVPIIPAPDSAPLMPDTVRRKIDGQWVPLKVSSRWAYTSADGDVIGYVCRFDVPGGGKEVIPQVWAANTETGECEWRWLSFPKPRPLYGLDILAENPKAQVMVVEGEKAADAARSHLDALGIGFDKLVVVSWPGGSKAIKFVDWSPLAGRRVGLWPDADQKPYPTNHPRAGELMLAHEQPGMQAMLAIDEALVGVAEAVRLFVPPAGVPDGWDLADEFPADWSLLNHIRTAAVDPAKLRPVVDDEPAVEVVEDEPVAEPEPVADPEPVPTPDPEPVAEKPDAKPAKKTSDTPYFTALGYDHDKYYFFQNRKKQLLEYGPSNFTDAGLLGLADLSYWEMEFPADSSLNKKAAINALIGWCHRAGIYDPSRTRGRGAWTDAGRVVLHMGSQLIVDGDPVDVTGFPSRYIYELDRSFPDLSPVALSDQEGREIVRLAKMFRWSMPASAAMLAGWVALAPLCGALKWRPHIWLSGGAGSGKSTILNSYVHVLMNDMGLMAQGNSTEPGIRQELRCDARPVLVDEGEQNDDKERARMQSILAMIRQASSESAARTYKGTSSGKSMHFHVRSMFCLASIQVGMCHQADKERLTVLNLRPKRESADAAGDWEKIKESLYQLERDKSLPARLFRRSLDLLPITLKNVDVFANAAAKKFGSQRDGDQYGTLMAGVWSLISSKEATPDEAVALLDHYDWTDYMEHADNDEASSALSALMEARVRVSSSVEWCVHEVASVVVSGIDHPELTVDAADKLLQRHGIRVKDGLMLFSNTSIALPKLVAHTSYATDIRGHLKRIQGATNYDNKAISIGASVSKCIAVPALKCLPAHQPLDSIKDDVAPF